MPVGLQFVVIMLIGERLSPREVQARAAFATPTPWPSEPRTLVSGATASDKPLTDVRGSAKVWSRHGSTLYLWTEKAVSEKCQYVREEQGPDLPGSSGAHT